MKMRLYRPLLDVRCSIIVSSYNVVNSSFAPIISHANFQHAKIALFASKLNTLLKSNFIEDLIRMSKGPKDKQVSLKKSELNHTSKKISKPQPKTPVPGKKKAPVVHKKQTQFSQDDLIEKAKQIYETRVKGVRANASKSEDFTIMKKILKSGTFADKVSALTIEIRDRPKLSLEYITPLIQMTSTKNRKQATLALNALFEVFTEILLPKNKVLNNFKAALATRKGHSDNDLFEAYYEHLLREYCFRFIGCLQNGLNDDLGFFREKIVDLLGRLIDHLPSLYQNIFPLLVNKFGDKDKKLIVNLNTLLGKLVFRHVTLALPLIKEIEQFTMRPNNHESAQYYAVNFLFAMNYKELDSTTLIYLTNLLFKLFFHFMKTKKDLEKAHKITKVLLSALNKAYMFCKNLGENFRETLEENINDLFRLCHDSGFKIKVQSLVLIFQFLKTTNSLSDRFYRVLYELLLDPTLKKSTDLQLVFDLLLNALKEDFSLARVEAFMKRLLQVASQSEPSFIITSLLFISKILEFHPAVSSLFGFKDPARGTDQDDKEEVFKDVPDSDDEKKTQEKPAKGEKQGKNAKNEKPEKNGKPGKDAKGAKNDKSAKKGQDKTAQANGEEPVEAKPFSTDYDPLKREPLYANADKTLLYELLPIANHFHPTVKKYATTLLNDLKNQGTVLNYQGNPLLDFSLANMLDRLEFKKPKLKLRARGNQPQKAKKMRMSKFLDPVSLETLQATEMRPEEEYFSKYFEQKAKTQKPKKKKKGGEEGDMEDEAEMDAFADELFERELAKGDDDIDDDDDFMDEEDEEDEMRSDDEDFGEMLGQGSDDGEGDYYNEEMDVEDEDFDDDEE